MTPKHPLYEAVPTKEIIRYARKLLGDILQGKQCPPRRVIRALNDLGLIVQEEHGLHEPRICYPLRRAEFEKRCKELEIIQ